jgi:hypothetical protein
MDIRVKTFAAEAIRRLNFLLDEHGFAGPEVQGDRDTYPLLISVYYHRSDLDVEASLVLSYAGEEYVTVRLLHADDQSGAARRTEVGTSTAHTGYQMRRALDRHAQAVRDAVHQAGPTHS